MNKVPIFFLVFLVASMALVTTSNADQVDSQLDILVKITLNTQTHIKSVHQTCFSCGEFRVDDVRCRTTRLTEEVHTCDLSLSLSLNSMCLQLQPLCKNFVSLFFRWFCITH